MRRLHRQTLRTLLVRTLLVIGTVVAAGVAWKWDELQRLWAVNSLFAEDRIVHNFSNMDELFLTQELPRGSGPVSALPPNPRPLPELDDWAEARALTAIVVLKDGELVHEDYFQGTGPEDQRISWSVAKSFLSALLGILLEEGAVDSLADPVTRYAPELAGTAYDGATIRDVLQMASGVQFDEDYLDFHSDINRMGRVLALGTSMDAFVANLSERARQPGEAWDYVSIDSHAISMVIRGATGRSTIDLMTEKLIQPLGLEASPYYLTDGHGVAFALGGLNMRTRDYARFGQMFLRDGHWNGEQIVPAEWVRASTTPSAPTAEDATHYGYQWWIPNDAPDGEFLARGVYGQYIYVNRPAGVVIAMNSADRDFREPGVFEQNLVMFRRIARSLQ